MLCRLTFSNDLKKENAFNKTPYHYCAASGNADLAAYLYSLGVPFDQDITVATFSADGKESRTPWNKALAISPMDTARMAGKSLHIRCCMLLCLHDVFMIASTCRSCKSCRSTGTGACKSAIALEQSVSPSVSCHIQETGKCMTRNSRCSLDLYCSCDVLYVHFRNMSNCTRHGVSSAAPAYAVLCYLPIGTTLK